MSILDFWIRPSTRQFAAEFRRNRPRSLLRFIHGYVYLRFPYLYISVGIGEHRLAQWLEPLGKLFIHPPLHADGPHPAGETTPGLADSYHGKVLPFDTARRLVTVDRPIPRTDLEKVIPFTRARDIVLEHPDAIVVLDCPCRSARKDPCLPLDVCLIVGEPFARFTLEHHPGRSRRIRQTEAVEILQAEHERGHVHHAFFKDAALNRFYAICNCCSCCCGAMQAHRNGTPMLISSGYVSRIDERLCIGCGDCHPRCQFHALEFHGSLTHVNDEACMGCGVCVDVCQHGAVTLERRSDRGTPLDVCALETRASV